VLANNQAAAPFTVAVGPADLAVTDFSLQQTSVPQGGSVAHSAWSVKNVGGATSGVFTREMILASDSLFVNPVARVAVTGTAVAPGGIVSVGASSFPVSKCQAPGQYFLGPLVYTSPADTNPANNQTSRAIVVTQGAPYAAQGPSSSPWGSMATHGGAFTHQLYPECAVLTYDNSGHLGGTYNNPVETFDFWTTAVATGPVTFKWTYQACHSWYQAQAGLRAWVSNGQGRVYTTLLPFGNYGCPFGSSGTVTLNLTAGQQWGVEAKGDHYDSSKVLNGTITLSVP